MAKSLPVSAMRPSLIIHIQLVTLTNFFLAYSAYLVKVVKFLHQCIILCITYTRGDPYQLFFHEPPLILFIAYQVKSTHQAQYN